MNDSYEFLTGPALWAAFSIFIVGLVARVAYIYGLSRGRDMVSYNHLDLKWAFRSILQRMSPFGSVSLRTHPVFAIASLLFRVCLLGVPIFLLAHNTLWNEAFGISLPSMSDSFADVLTVLFVISASMLLARRILLSEVRILSTAWDYFFLFLTSASFVTGFLAYHQSGPYKLILVLHIFFSEVLLIAIPFSKIGYIIPDSFEPVQSDAERNKERNLCLAE